MTLTEIKKELYKQKPVAHFISCFKDGLTYETKFIINADTNLKENVSCYFRVPFTDIGDAIFHPQMSAQLLIRYIVTPETENK